MSAPIRVWLGETEVTAQASTQPDLELTVLKDGSLEMINADADLGAMGKLSVLIPAALMPVPPLVQTEGYAPIENRAELEALPIATMVRDSDTGEYWLRRDDRQLWHCPATWASPMRTDRFHSPHYPFTVVVMGNGVACHD